MPNPREAIYDVLNAQRQRQLDTQLTRTEADSLLDEWQRYEEANNRAKEAYQPKGKR